MLSLTDKIFPLNPRPPCEAGFHVHLHFIEEERRTERLDHLPRAAQPPLADPGLNPGSQTSEHSL